MIRTRGEMERLEAENLAPYAMCSGHSRGRAYADDEHPYRSAFQKDRDRIIHTTAFRRLEYKTQVFVYHEGDHYRTRLTHSIEVSQIGRTLTRALCANEDLIEAICLSHDLGHPPFGHTGEATLNRLLTGHGGFDHQKQTMRILTYLERRFPDFPGLNLTYEVREGVVKHDTDYDVVDASAYEPEKAATLESQLANLADEIAYNTSDLDDGLRSGILDPMEVRELALWKDAMKALGEKVDCEITTLLRHRAIRKLVGFEVTDVIQATDHSLRQSGVQSVDDVRSLGRNLAAYSAKMAEKNGQLKKFLLRNFYLHYRVVRMASKANRILTDLFNAYMEEPAQLPKETQGHIAQEPEGLVRVVADYIAGMTDRYALDEHTKLFDPVAKT